VQKRECWPPPEGWTQVVVSWNIMLHHSDHAPNDIIDWVENHPGGEYHLHGYRSIEGFAFRFSNPADALLFKLKWNTQ
jgi:hypothetical protein